MMERSITRLDLFEKADAVEAAAEPGSRRSLFPDRSTPSLTPRELQVIGMLALGSTNKGIAHALGVSVHTVKYHLKASFRKFRVRGRLEAVTVAYELGLIRFPRDQRIDESR